MDYMERYSQWLTDNIFDNDTKKELEKIRENPKEIEDRFYKDLEFGTGGLRGVIGAGTNRMNRYTVGRATQGLANYIKKKEIQNPSVVIAYDSRHFSPEFSREAAKVLNANGISVYLFSELRPTPELSFAVRQLGAAAGIVITASHNPPEYNGYKVYWNDGGQVVSPIAEELIAEANAIQDFSQIKCLEDCLPEGGTVFTKMIGEDLDNLYIKKVSGLSLNPDIVKKVSKDLKIVYTPLHGSGNKLVRRVLCELGFEDVVVVPEQELPDGSFRTVKSPNPEEREAFAMAIALAEKIGADLIIGTDPDCDRVGLVVKDNEGKFVTLTGNQTGALLINYVLSSMKEKDMLNDKSVLIDTIVTGKMGAEIAAHYGVKTISVLTGFKYIAEKIKSFEKTGQHFTFGYEESYGYLAGDFVRDKDAVIASMLICEMAAMYKNKGISIYEGLMELYKNYGYHKETGVSIAFKGKEGMEQMRGLLDRLRTNAPTVVNGLKVIEVRDYLNRVSPDIQVKENVLFFLLEDQSWFCIRPSGTEPKLKVYFSVIGNNLADAENRMDTLKSSVEAMIG